VTATVRKLKRRAAARPAPRTVEVTLPPDSPYPGWWAIARADFPARLFQLLGSRKLADLVAALGVIILEHNMPDTEGEVAEELLDVDPALGLAAMAAAIAEAIGQLPNR
jgi:hypothetical protein